MMRDVPFTSINMPLSIVSVGAVAGLGGSDVRLVKALSLRGF